MQWRKNICNWELNHLLSIFSQVQFSIWETFGSRDRCFCWRSKITDGDKNPTDQLKSINNGCREQQPSGTWHFYSDRGSISGSFDPADANRASAPEQPGWRWSRCFLYTTSLKRKSRGQAQCRNSHGNDGNKLPPPPPPPKRLQQGGGHFIWPGLDNQNPEVRNCRPGCLHVLGPFNHCWGLQTREELWKAFRQDGAYQLEVYQNISCIFSQHF